MSGTSLMLWVNDNNTELKLYDAFYSTNSLSIQVIHAHSTEERTGSRSILKVIEYTVSRTVILLQL